MSIVAPLRAEKFQDPLVTADGKHRASVSMAHLHTLWINTGTLCNLTCRNCYIESSPKNDRLAYISADEVSAYLDEVEALNLGTHEIGFTGGEPFMNPDFLDMLEDVLSRGLQAMVLTNAMKPMMKVETRLAAIADRYPNQLTVRASLDHHTKAGHEEERGARSWDPTIRGLQWLDANGITTHVAGRRFIDEAEDTARMAYAALFDDLGLSIDSQDPGILVLFPEMDAARDVPEITTECWDILDVHPESVMCASSRMVIKRKGAPSPTVVACTLLPYDDAFDLGPSLKDSFEDISLNHPFCAQFCVLGGASCSQS